MVSIYRDYEVDNFFRNASVSFSGGRCTVSISHPWREKVYEADAKTMRVESIRERISYGGIDASGKPFKGWSEWYSPWDASLAPEACIGDDFELARWQAGEEREKVAVSSYLRRYAEVHS